MINEKGFIYHINISKKKVRCKAERSGSDQRKERKQNAIHQCHFLRDHVCPSYQSKKQCFTHFNIRIRIIILYRSLRANKSPPKLSRHLPKGINCSEMYKIREVPQQSIPKYKATLMRFNLFKKSYSEPASSVHKNETSPVGLKCKIATLPFP